MVSVTENLNNLLTPTKVGIHNLKNKVVMAAMTRMRADPKNGIPNELNVKYYSERAEDAGFVLSECSAISQEGEGFPGNTQIFTKEHQEGWQKVADEVHKVNGLIFTQIYHCGRATNSEKTGGKQPVGASNILNRHSSNYNKFEEPRELSVDEIKQIVKQFGASAQLLKNAGVDGVELHAANGYLVDQFIKDCTNNRKDEYGGSIENRCRFALEIIDELITVYGSGSVGIKLSPVGRYNDMYDSDPMATLNYILPELNKRNIAFVEISRAPDGTENIQYEKKGEEQISNLYTSELKKLLPNVSLIGNNKFSGDEAEKMIKENLIDLVSFGQNYIGNPDLCLRLKNGYPLTSPDWSKAYFGGENGYCDYPKYKKVD